VKVIGRELITEFASRLQWSFPRQLLAASKRANEADFDVRFTPQKQTLHVYDGTEPRTPMQGFTGRCVLGLGASEPHV
jgi:hypothetical protein